VRGAPAVLGSGNRNAPSTSTEMIAASIQMATQHVLAAAEAPQFAEPAAMGLFDTAAETDADKALDRVMEGLRAVEGLEEGRLVGHVSKGFASAEFANLVEGAVKAKLKAEAKGLINARHTDKTASQDEIDRFMRNAAAAVEAALGLVYKVMEKRWEAKSKSDEAGRENYAHTSEELVEAFDVRKRKEVHYLRYDVDDVMYGDARAEGVVVLIFLGGGKSIRVEVLAKSVVNIPARFDEVELDGERWVRLATAWINKPSGAKNYVAQIKPRLRLEDKVSRDAASMEGLRGLLVTDASGKEIRTPDPLLVKLFAYHFEKVKVEVAGVSHTEASFALQFRAIARDEEPFERLFGDIAEKYGKKLWEVVDKAKDMWLEVMRKLSEDIKRVAEEVAKVGKREGVEAGRRALVEGLRHLFEEKEREAGYSEEALAIAVAGRLMVDIVNSPREWFSLLVGDGVVDIAHKTLGFSAKYAEVAEAVLRLLAVWAGAYGTVPRVMNERATVYANSEDATRVLKALFVGDVLECAVSLARSWNGLAGSHAPKLISLLTLAQLLNVVEGKWAIELWLAHKATATPTPPEAAKALNKLLSRVEWVEGEKWTEGGVSLYFKLRGEEGAELAAVFRLYTNFHDFHLYCHLCSEASARRILGAVAEELRLAVEQLERRLRLAAAEERLEWPKWEGNALVLPAEVGWPLFLKLWKRHKMSLPVEEGRREVLRVEVLEARADGLAKFRLWYYKWRETRPEQPYVDFEITPYQRKDGIRFRGYVYANGAEGILRDHLAEIAELLKRKGVKGVSLRSDGKVLEFSGAFRNSVLAKVDVSPEPPRTEPIAVEHLGGFRFKVGDKEVEFSVKAIGARRELYAELRLASAEEVVRFAASLKAVGVEARATDDVVRLDSDSFFGLLAATGAVPPGLTPLYRSDDLHVYANVEGDRMRFYFAVRHEGMWRIAEGLYNENLKGIMLILAEREVLEAIRSAVAKALERLGRPAKVREPSEVRDREDTAKAYRLYLCTYHFMPFLECAAERVRAEPAEVRLKGRHIAVRTGSVKAKLVFKPLKFGKAEYFITTDVEQTLALYKSLKEVGVPVEITPKGVKVDGEAMWALVATAVERSTPNKLPAEVMPGVELLNMYSAGGMKLYVFRADGAHYYFAVKTGQGWRATGGKHAKWQVMIAGEAARTVADAINAIYREIGVERKVEARYYKDGVPYIKLTNVDLELLDIKRKPLQP